MGDTREMAAKFEEVLKSGDLGGMSALGTEYSSDWLL
jgi:hypothetical protein